MWVEASQDRSRFLVVHDCSVAIDQRGPFRDICLALTDLGADAHVIEAGSAEHAAELCSDVINGGGYDAILYAGASAVLHGVQFGLQSSDLPVGVLPVGGGETLGRTLGFRGKPRQIASTLITAPSVPFPGLQINGSNVSVMVALGPDSDILGRLSRYLCPAAPKTKYASSLGPNLLKTVERFDAVVDGMNFRCSSLFVMRTSGFCGLSDVPLVSSGSDGPLTAVLVEADDRVALFDVMVAAKLGRLFKDSSVSVRACHHIEVPGGQSLAIDTDGQNVGNGVIASSGLHVQASPIALNVIAAREVMELLASTDKRSVAA